MDRVPSYAVICVADNWDSVVASMVRRNAARIVSGTMHVVADESAGPVSVPCDCRGTRATMQAAAELGLRTDFRDALFRRNGDYLFHVFFYANPRYDYYVFLCGDVVLNTDVDAFVADVARRGADHIRAPAAQEAGVPALTVLSRRALAHLFLRRRQMSLARCADEDSWPACETFLRSEIEAAGFLSAPLEAFGSVQRSALRPSALADAELPSGFILPTLPRPRLMQSVLSRSRTRDSAPPRGPIWRAIRSCRDWGLATPFGAEIARRASRRDGYAGGAGGIAPSGNRERA